MVSTRNTNFWSPPNSKNNNKKATKHITNNKVKYKNKLEQQKLTWITDHMIRKKQTKPRSNKNLEMKATSKTTSNKDTNEQRNEIMPSIPKDIHNIKEDLSESREKSIISNKREDYHDLDQKIEKDAIMKETNIKGITTKEIKSNTPYTDALKDTRKKETKKAEAKSVSHIDNTAEIKKINSQAENMEDQPTVNDNAKVHLGDKQPAVAR
jgi:hypothetical protein